MLAASYARLSLQNAGITRRQVSVRVTRGITYEALRFTIRDPGLDRAIVDSIAADCRSVSYCSVSGEILAGGDTFCSVRRV